MATSWAVLIALASVVFMDPTVPLREPQCESSYALPSSDARRCAVGMEISGEDMIGTAGPLSAKTTTRFPDSEAVLRCRPPTVSCNDRAIDVPDVIRCKEEGETRDVLRLEVGGDQTGVRASTRCADSIHSFRRH